MARATKTAPSQQTIIDLCHEIDRALPVDEWIDRYLARFVSTAKNPRKQARVMLRELEGAWLAFVGDNAIVPLAVAMCGLRFRIPLDTDTLRTGLPMGRFNYYIRRPDHTASFHGELVDVTGASINTRWIREPSSERTPLLEMLVPDMGLLDISEWLASQQASADDHLLLTVLDWEAASLQVAIERPTERRETEIALRTSELADRLYYRLDTNVEERLYLPKHLPSVLLSLPDPYGYPGSHWWEALAQDTRMVATLSYLAYNDGTPHSMIEHVALANSGQRWGLPLHEFSREDGRAIYCFVAEPTNYALEAAPSRSKRGSQLKTSIRRVVKVNGNDALPVLDAALRSAFELDPDEHLSGFWKLILRTKGRDREVLIGTLAPPDFTDEEGDEIGLNNDARPIAVAALGLIVGDRLRYLYDFGESLEHVLTLESIQPAAPSAAATSG